MAVDSREDRRTIATLRDGVKAAWPICLGYMPIGLALGVLAQKAGISPPEIGFMSLLVFAGSAQFIAVSMISGGSSILPVVVTTFMVNLRHLLMSSSLAVHLRPAAHPLFVSLFAYGITDESFAVNTARFKDGSWDPGRALVVNQVSNGVWVLSTIAGGYGGHFIPEGSLGIDYALSAMFLCLLVYQLRGAIYAVTAVIAGGLSVLWALVLPGNAYLIIASILAATAGYALRQRIFRKAISHDTS